MTTEESDRDYYRWGKPQEQFSSDTPAAFERPQEVRRDPLPAPRVLNRAELEALRARIRRQNHNC
jgi:hypothetical protein